MRKISICGSFSTGKTTLINLLKQTTSEVDCKYNFIDDLAREYISNNNLDINNACEEQLIEMQHSLVEKQFKLEQFYDRFLTDGGLIEMLAYSNNMGTSKKALKAKEKIETKIKEYFNSYGKYHIVFLTDINDCKLDNDGIRNTDIVLRQKIHDLIKYYLIKYQINHHIISGTPSERLKKIKQILINYYENN